MCVSVNDTLDDILTESGDEEEQDAIVSQVLDEIGIDITGKVRHCRACGCKKDSQNYFPLIGQYCQCIVELNQQLVMDIRALHQRQGRSLQGI